MGRRVRRARGRLEFAAALVCALLLAPAAARPAPPPIIVLSLDTLRADHLPSYGYARATAPTLDAFASEAVRFDEAIAQANATLPSHLSLITSLYPPHFRITRSRDHTNQIRTRLRLPDAVQTLTEVLRDAGYETAAFTDGAFMNANYGFDQGFDTFSFNRYSTTKPDFGLRFTLHKLASFLDERSRAAPEKPLFLFVHSYDVHEPYDAPPPYDRVFGELSYAQLTEELGVKPRPRLLDRRADELSQQQVDAVRALYDNGIRRADALVGELFSLFRRHGLYDPALLVVLSDHGEEFREHGRFGHGLQLYRENVRVPLLIRLPEGRHGGRVVHEPVALLDVAPTLLELAGLPIPDQFAGRSLAPAVAGRPMPSLASRPIYFECANLEDGVYGMQRGRWKIVRARRGGASEIYDLTGDPGETRNLVDGDPVLRDDLASQLETWQREMEATGRRNRWLSIPQPDAGGGAPRDLGSEAP